jgi:hypothetical protein
MGVVLCVSIGKEGLDQLFRISELLGSPNETTWPGALVLQVWARPHRDSLPGMLWQDLSCINIKGIHVTP